MGSVRDVLANPESLFMIYAAMAQGAAAQFRMMSGRLTRHFSFFIGLPSEARK
jgi:hypothetical protein